MSVIRILESEIHTVDLPDNTLLTAWTNQNGEQTYVCFGTMAEVPSAHRDGAFTDTLAGWRKRIANSEPFEAYLLNDGDVDFNQLNELLDD